MRTMTPEALDREVHALLRFHGYCAWLERLPESVMTIAPARPEGLQATPGGLEWLTYEYDVEPLWLPHGQTLYGGLLTLCMFRHRGWGYLGYVVRGPTPRRERPQYFP